MECQTHEQTKATASNDLDELEAHVQSLLAGRVRAVRLVPCKEGLILQGRALTYYAKQLAQHAVMTATTLPIVANEIEVP
jgi:hypothetical protein